MALFEFLSNFRVKWLSEPDFADASDDAGSGHRLFAHDPESDEGEPLPPEKEREIALFLLTDPDCWF